MGMCVLQSCYFYSVALADLKYSQYPVPLQLSALSKFQIETLLRCYKLFSGTKYEWKLFKHWDLAWIAFALSTFPLIALQCEGIGGEKVIGQILLLYLKDMAFETRFDNLEANNSCNLKGVVLSFSDYRSKITRSFHGNTLGTWVRNPLKLMGQGPQGRRGGLEGVNCNPVFIDLCTAVLSVVSEFLPGSCCFSASRWVAQVWLQNKVWA